MKIIKEYNQFINSYSKKDKYLGKFMNKSIYVSDDYFKWGDKKSFLEITDKTRMIDIIRIILKIENTLKIDNYRDFITYTLGSLYDKDIINIDGIDTITLQDFDIYNENNKSILNYLNTNNMVKNYLLRLYNEKDENSSTFFKKIWNDRNDIFLKSGKIFKEVLRLLNAAVNKGKAVEDKTVVDTLEFFKNLLNDDSIIITTGNLKEDLLKGVDLKIISNTNKYVKTIQVKALKEYKYNIFNIEEFNDYINSINNRDVAVDNHNKILLSKLNKSNLKELEVFQLSTDSVTKIYHTDFIIYKENNTNKYYISNNQNIFYDISKLNIILADKSVDKKQYGDVQIIYIYN